MDVKRGTDVSTLPPAPTLYLTAKPVTYQTPYASAKEELSLAGKLDSFPREFNSGSEASDILVPSEQYELLAGILAGTDVVICARLDSSGGDPTTRDAGDLTRRAVGSGTRSANATRLPLWFWRACIWQDGDHTWQYSIVCKMCLQARPHLEGVRPAGEEGNDPGRNGH